MKISSKADHPLVQWVVGLNLFFFDGMFYKGHLHLFLWIYFTICRLSDNDNFSTLLTLNLCIIFIMVKICVHMSYSSSLFS